MLGIVNGKVYDPQNGINGKVRDRITLPAGFTQEEAQEVALQSEVVKRHLEGKEPRKVIVVPGKLVNIVV